MRNRFVLLGAAAAFAMAGFAQAQVLGGGAVGGVGSPLGGVTGQVGGQVTGPGVPVDRVTGAARDGVDTTRRTTKRVKDKARSTSEQVGETARGAADSATDASARAAASATFAAGTTVRDNNGAEIGKVVSADGSGSVQIQTRSGMITLPAAALRMNGGVAVSEQSEAEIRASGSARAN
ncbi:MAG: hypothetical protein Q8J89_11465 [Caulobacter sp.]|nr:hypothetical protein [Caulobacter sp.]